MYINSWEDIKTHSFVRELLNFSLSTLTVLTLLTHTSLTSLALLSCLSLRVDTTERAGNDVIRASLRSNVLAAFVQLVNVSHDAVISTDADFSILLCCPRRRKQWTT